MKINERKNTHWSKLNPRDWSEKHLREFVADQGPDKIVLFMEYNLPPYRAAHALMFYYFHARKMYEEVNLQDRLVYEGDPDPQADYFSLFKSVAIRYNVTCEQMAKFWDSIDLACALNNMPRLPNEDRFRFNKVIELRSPKKEK